MFSKSRKSFQKAISILLVVLLLSVSGGIQSLAAGELIFHSGFEPGSTGVPDYRPATSTSPAWTDYGAIEDITGTDNSFSTDNNWVNDFDGHPNIGNFNIEYESKDNSHQRYARIVDDPTNMLFEDSFDDAYAPNDTPHCVSSDMGKRNWSFYTTADTTMTVIADPLDSTNINQAMKILSTKSTTNYPKIEKLFDASSSGRVLINYKIMNLSRSTYIDLTLPNVSGAPYKSNVIKVQSSSAIVGSLTKSIDPNQWTTVSLDIDLLNNTYSATVNEDTFATNQVLFDTPQADFTGVKVRFNCSLGSQSYYYLDDVKIMLTNTKFEDNFDLNYSINDTPHQVSSDKGRVNWSYFTPNSADTNISVQQDPILSTNKVIKVTGLKATSVYPKLDKNLDLSASQKMTIDYRVYHNGKTSYIDIDLPSVSGVPTKTNVVKFQSNKAYVGTAYVDVASYPWTTVSIKCDLYNNTYTAFVNGTQVGSTTQLFSSPQTDFRNIRTRFNASLSGGNYYYLDDIKITNTSNQILKYYGGKVINDSKLRAQTHITTSNSPTYYYKYRVYFGDGFEPFKTQAQNISGYWLTLAEFFDGTNWQYVYDPENPVPNYCSRISMGIAKPTGAGNPLKFTVNFEHSMLYEADWALPPIWDYDSDGTNGNGNVDVPIGKWVTIEVYLKQGIGTEGKFQMYMTPDDGVKQTVFDISNDTYNANAPANGFDHAYPLKFYGNKNVFNNLNTVNSDLIMYWDDFEFWTDKP